MTHSYHPDTHEFGLADGCPKCYDYATRTLHSLDTPNLRSLLDALRASIETAKA